MHELKIFNRFVTSKPVILIAPLDWGLGHATRCIPIISYLISIGCEVIIASEGRQEAIFKMEFSNVRFERLKGYRLSFGKSGFKTIIKILLQIPGILTSISYDRHWLDNFLRHHRVDAILSDNRYGMFSMHTPCVLITHQLTIKTPFGSYVEKLIRSVNYRLINKFSECWVPDHKGKENLAGELSHPEKMPSIPVKYLGMLSRIYKVSSQKRTDLLIMLSGPEPQRSILENILLKQLKKYPHPAVLVRGLPGEENDISGDYSDLLIYNHLCADNLNQVINDSRYIISRSGYSTIMDLLPLEKNCIFIPTPGQSEQEYLARYLSNKKLCVSYSQNNFCLHNALKEAGQLKPHKFEVSDKDLYKKLIDDFIKRL